MPAATLAALLLALLCSLFPTSSANFTDVHGFQDSTPARRDFTPQDFKGQYSRFLELSNVNHMCPLKIHISSNGQLLPQNIVRLQHSALQFDQAPCTDAGSLLFHYANQLTPDQIRTHFRLTGSEPDFFQRGLYKFLSEVRSFYLAVESIPISCGNNSLQAGGAVLFSSDSAIFGGELHLPYHGFPKIVYIRDATKTCAYFGPWMTHDTNTSDASMGASGSNATGTPSVGATKTPAPSFKGTITPTPTVSPPSGSTSGSATGAGGTSGNNGDGMTSSGNGESMGSTAGTGAPTTTAGSTMSGSIITTTTAPGTAANPTTSTDAGTSGSQVVSGTTPSTTGTNQVGTTESPGTSANGGMVDATSTTTAPPNTVSGSTVDASATTQSVDAAGGGTSSPSSTAAGASSAVDAATTSLAGTEIQNAGTGGTGTSAPTTTISTPSTSTPATTGVDKGVAAGSGSGSSTSTTTVATTAVESGTQVDKGVATGSGGETANTMDVATTPPESGTDGTSSSSANSSPSSSPAPSSGSTTASPTTTNLVQTTDTSSQSSTTAASGGSSMGSDVSVGPQPEATGPVQDQESNTPQPDTTSAFNLFESPFVFPMPSFQAPSALAPSPIEQGIETISPSVSATTVDFPVFPSPSTEPVNSGQEPIPTADGHGNLTPEPSAAEIFESFEPNPGMNITESDVESDPSLAVKSPSPSPSRSANSNDESTCFPAHAIVLLQSGRKLRMDSLRIGDMVHVGEGHFSPIIGFTHANPWALSKFVKMTTLSGLSVLVTPTHYMHSSRGLLPAKSLSTDDSLILSDGSQSRITAAVMTQSLGLYNPQTAHGDIDVDGVLASTYTTAVHPAGAHSLLAPVRMLHKLNVHMPLVSVLSDAVWLAKAARGLLGAS